MTNKSDPGKTARPLDTQDTDHAQLRELVFRARESAIEAHQPAVMPPLASGDGRYETCHLLEDMRETHRAMQVIAKLADEEQQPSGVCADMLLLARVQYDRAVQGMLFAHDPKKWIPRYYRSGWFEDVKRSFRYDLRYAGVSEPKYQNLLRDNRTKRKQSARKYGVTGKEFRAVLAFCRGRQLTSGQGSLCRGFWFPTSTTILKDGELKGSQYERLVQLLWQLWNSLCGPQHANVNCAVKRAVLRGEFPSDRVDSIRNGLILDSLGSSLVAIMTLVTIVAQQHPEDVNLQADVALGWGPLPGGTFEGSIIWDGWARNAIHAIS